MRVDERKVELTSWKFSSRVEVIYAIPYIAVGPLTELINVDSSPICMHYQYLPTVMIDLLNNSPQLPTSLAMAT